MKTITYAFPHGLIFLSSPTDMTPPVPTYATQFRFTQSCLSVVCQHEQEGTTELSIGTPEEVDPGYAPVVSGVIATPTRQLAVSTSAADDILSISVPDIETLLRVWVNHRQWPDKVQVGIGGAEVEHQMSRNVFF
ncbi:hypothetical protein E8L99_13075 [Phreatobacter aquaticus]|uniref:Uncharacterized protein n=1 Tax=Phreatobacter aquaticus TaxID=2570229 RepID=A0A4D7QRA8_9HYPH|nr:hypothetical protein [Phreatobacter aquaticus]QCK86622.1 hypothetical protein E8L99_13075 [Phreatobacter aquaticus]